MRRSPPPAARTSRSTSSHDLRIAVPRASPALLGLGIVTRARISALAAIAAVVLAGAFVAYRALSVEAPDETAERFVERWSAGDDAAAARLTDDPRAATAALKANRQGLDGATVRATLGDVEESGDSATAALSLRWRIPGIGRWGYDSKLRLRRSGDEWQVRWAPTVVHPKLDDRHPPRDHLRGEGARGDPRPRRPAADARAAGGAGGRCRRRREAARRHRARAGRRARRGCPPAGACDPGRRQAAVRRRDRAASRRLPPPACPDRERPRRRDRRGHRGARPDPGVRARPARHRRAGHPGAARAARRPRADRSVRGPVGPAGPLRATARARARAAGRDPGRRRADRHADHAWRAPGPFGDHHPRPAGAGGGGGGAGRPVRRGRAGGGQALDGRRAGGGQPPGRIVVQPCPGGRLPAGIHLQGRVHRGAAAGRARRR